MSTNHILETVVEKLTTELNNRCTEYGFEERVKSKLPNLKLSVKILIGNVLVAESKHSGKGYSSIHLDKNWYSDSTRYKTKHSYRIFVERAYGGLIHLGYLDQAKARSKGHKPHHTKNYGASRS